MGGVGEGEEDEAEARRAAMRVALARRMKQELLLGEAGRLQRLHDEQHEELGQQLQRVRGGGG